MFNRCASAAIGPDLHREIISAVYDPEEFVAGCLAVEPALDREGVMRFLSGPPLSTLFLMVRNSTRAIAGDRDELARRVYDAAVYPRYIKNTADLQALVISMSLKELPRAGYRRVHSEIPMWVDHDEFSREVDAVLHLMLYRKQKPSNLVRDAIHEKIDRFSVDRICRIEPHRYKVFEPILAYYTRAFKPLARDSSVLLGVLLGVEKHSILSCRDGGGRRPEVSEALRTGDKKLACRALTPSDHPVVKYLAACTDPLNTTLPEFALARSLWLLAK